mmetsp:Transcript_10504/g.26073  ORF Transcript_10504/g.26073 Transcript_10504/m.26073 type:complete len:261 (+) Transcript_10504:149-931(+)
MVHMSPPDAEATAWPGCSGGGRLCAAPCWVVALLCAPAVSTTSSGRYLPWKRAVMRTSERSSLGPHSLMVIAPAWLAWCSAAAAQSASSGASVSRPSIAASGSWGRVTHMGEQPENLGSTGGSGRLSGPMPSGSSRVVHCCEGACQDVTKARPHACTSTSASLGGCRYSQCTQSCGCRSSSTCSPTLWLALPDVALVMSSDTSSPSSPAPLTPASPAVRAASCWLGLLPFAAPRAAAPSTRTRSTASSTHPLRTLHPRHW